MQNKRGNSNILRNHPYMDFTKLVLSDIHYPGPGPGPLLTRQAKLMITLACRHTLETSIEVIQNIPLEIHSIQHSLLNISMHIKN